MSLPFLGSQSIPPEMYQDLSYRLIGPFRASRTVGAVGIPDQPNVFFLGKEYDQISSKLYSKKCLPFSFMQFSLNRQQINVKTSNVCIKQRCYLALGAITNF